MIEETPAEAQEAPEVSRDAKPWLDMIADGTKFFAFYHEKCDSIDKLYANLENLAKAGTEREFQTFWANLEVLKPSIYARPPAPVVTTRHKDRKELPRVASELLQRDLETIFDTEDINSTMIAIRDDLAISARGAAWLRYEFEPDEQEESVCFEHTDREDFLHEPARKWKEVSWVARRSFLNHKKGVKRFGDVWLKATFKDKQDDKDNYKGEKKAAVWEIWHKELKKVVWVTEGVEEVLDIQDPFLKLEGFFPCPRPAYGTLQRRTLLPVPDFVYYKDQIEEINELTARISALAEGLRLKGFYAAGQEDLSTAIERAMKDQSNNAILIPVANYGALGGANLKEAIVWLPIAEVVATVQSCVELRRQFIEDVYQITGLSDIMRGATDPNETLGAQELKSQYGNVRIRDRQAELIRIARDMTRMAGEIIAENFQPQTMIDMAQMELPTDADIQGQIDQIMAQVQQATQNPQMMQMAQENPDQAQQMKQQVQDQIAKLEKTVTIDKIVALLREQRMRPFVLDIETDSTIQPDENAEKKMRAEFMTALGGFLGQAAPMLQGFPESGPFVAETLKFVVSPFRAGRELDGAIDTLSEQISGMANKPKGPSPEEIKAKADAEARQAEMAMKDKEHQARLQELTVSSQAKQEENKFKIMTEQMKFANEMQRRNHDVKRFEMDQEDRTNERTFKGKQLELDAKGKMVEAGLPPDYSFEDDRAQFQAIMDEMKTSREAQMQMMQMMAQQTASIAQGMEALAKAVTAPKSARKMPDGSYAMQSVVQ